MILSLLWFNCKESWPLTNVFSTCTCRPIASFWHLRNFKLLWSCQPLFHVMTSFFYGHYYLFMEGALWSLNLKRGQLPKTGATKSLIIISWGVTSPDDVGTRHIWLVISTLTSNEQICKHMASLNIEYLYHTFHSFKFDVICKKYMYFP